VGFAAYSFLWAAVGLTRSLYLKEMYVADQHRGQGVGRLLMSALFEVAAKHECSRVEWTTDRDNPGAQAFYDRLGVPPLISKIFYRVEDTGAGLRHPDRPIPRHRRLPGQDRPILRSRHICGYRPR
jgi:RimJ/RimL family protein N-acetyltransferase